MARGRRHCVRRIALGVVVVVVGAIAASLIAMHTDWGRGMVRAQLEHQLESTFVGGATVGRIEGSPLGRLTLHDVVINGPDGRPAIAAKLLMVDLGILPLLSHQARVLALRAEDVDVDLRRDPDGELQIKRLTRPGPKSTWSVQLPRVELRRAHVRFDAGNEVVNLDGLTLDGRATMPHGGPIDASIELTGTWRERATQLELQTVVHSDDAGLLVPALVVKAGTVSATASQVAVRKTRGAPAISGTAMVNATAAEVARLVPSLRLPADVAVTVTAHPVAGQPWTELAIAGEVNRTPVRFVGAADLEARHARGELATGELDLARLTSGKVAGSAAATVVFDVRPGGPRALPVATATIRGWGTAWGVPRTSFDIALHSAGERVRATVDATGDRLRARLAANLRVLGDALTIEDSSLHATADPARASGGKAPVHGGVRIDLDVRGAVRPEPSLAVTGTIDGTGLRMQELSVAQLHASIDAKRLPNRPLGTAHVRLVDVVRENAQLGELTVDATDRIDGKVAVAVRSRPKQNPWLVEADALVTPPADAGRGRVVVDLVRHHVRVGATAASAMDWTGRGGHVEIDSERIAVRDLSSASRVGSVAVSGRYERGRRRGDLAANVDARSLSLDNLAGRYHGKVDARVAVTRQRGAWGGEIALDGTGLSIDPRDVVLDGHARATLQGRRIAMTANASSPQVGSAALAIDLDTPANVADAAAWKRLGRSAIRTGQLTLRGVEIGRAAELAGLAGAYGGRIDGDIRVSSDTTGGRIEARGIVAPQLSGVGEIGAVLDLSQTAPTELTPTLTVSAAGIGRASLQANLEMPDRLFDRAAWQRLGRGALRGATVRAQDIAIDPAMLDRFGVTSQMRGQLSVALDIGEAARTVKAAIDLAQLRGDPIVQPIDVHFEAAVDERAARSSLSVATKGTPLLQLEGSAPITLDQLLDGAGRRGDRDALLATRLDGTARLASVDAPRLLAVFGRSEIIAGAIDGTVAVAGTLGAPTVKADLVATGLKVPPGPHGKPVRVVDRMTVAASWDGTTAKLAIDGSESEGGKLQITGEARPGALRDGTLKVTATRFDLVPILAFVPGPAGAAAGQLDANLTMTGLDLRTTRLAGELHLLDARVPIAPTVGTLRQAKIDAIVGDQQINLIVDGKLGSGSVAVTGSIALSGAALNGGNAKITLRKISPIGVVEPQLTADITATLSHKDEQWRADLVVERANVAIPKDRGEKLDQVGAPPDMRFATGERITRRPKEQAPPSNPILITTIALRSTRVESEEFRGVVRGKLELRLDAQSIGMYGGIEADRGDVDLFGHRYYVEHAAVYFDGSLDPLVDARITHDFADVTTITEVHGRASAPELSLSSDPGTYSQDQLLGFLLGGEPSGDPQTGAASDKVTSAGQSYIANRLGGYVRDALPIDVDVLRYEAATSSSSAAIIVGTWITQSLFLAYRQHLESRPDENTGEGQVEWWLSRRVVVEATAGDKGYNGVDLLWRKRY